jgi:two-component system response regulator HupR/HoxA
MPIMDGVQFLREVKARYPSVVRIILSGDGDSGLTAPGLGVAHRLLLKPLDPEQLKAVLRKVLALEGGSE